MVEKIDRVFYVNLLRRADRRASVEAELEKVGLSGKAERFEADDVPDFGCIGCARSHLAALKLARERGYANVVMLEDDATFLVDAETMQRELAEFFSSGIEYDVCMLAYALEASEEVEGFDPLLRVRRATNGAAYLVSSSYYDKLIGAFEVALQGLELTRRHWIYAPDVAWQRLQNEDRWYCFKTRLAMQAADWSDCGQKLVDYQC